MDKVVNNLSQQVDAIAAKSNLTTGQILLWLGQKLNPGTPLYNMVFSFTIQGTIDASHFQQAFQQLVHHCDVLRLTIVEQDGIPQQQTAPSLDYPLPLIDFSAEADPHTASKRWMQERSTQCLNLETGLFDSALLQLAPDQFVWYFNQHHLITDNWSVSLLYRRLQHYYGQAIQGTLAETDPLPSYVSCTEKEQPLTWQQQSIDYWYQKKQSLPSATPLYGQTTDTATNRTERTYLHLDQARSDALRALAQTPEAQTLSIHQSQFNLFLTLVFAYLHRISGDTELAIAAPAHNRPTPVLKDTPGVFMELFPLQVTIEPEETFTSLLGKVAAESMAFLRYAQSGVSHHAINRDVNVVLSYINVTFPAFHGMPVHTDWIHSGYGDSQHHLRLEVHDFDATGCFTLQFDFNRDLISDSQRHWASEHFCKLLDAWLVNGQQPIGAVDILTEAEETLLAVPPSSSPDSTLVEKFQQQVDHAPEQTAVFFEDSTLTYRELDIKANQLAHYLINQGIKQGEIVGLFMERSVAMVVAIMGVLKAGAAYLPIDPAYPAERTNFMVEDGQISVLLTQQSLNCPNTAQVIVLADHDVAIAQQSAASPDVDITARDLAYILFTSGSTGKPKGVMVEHRNVLAMLQGFEHIAPAGANLKGTALCSYGFDVSVWEIFSILCFGGTLHLVPADVVTGGLAQHLINHRIISAYIPPALLPLVIQALENSEDDIPLDRILVGVEPIQQQLLQRYRQRIPQLRIVNGYGPTETTICATFYSFNAATHPQGITPIGRALPGYGVYLVNPQGQRVPMGVKGELVIGGAGLSRGYVNRPELMAEKFVENPFGHGQLYKTGDQARHLLDGNLEFLGRMDAQVKIRGFRVELREVETALGQHPDIEQVVVLAQKTQHTQSLIAYLITRNPHISRGDIRARLQQTLPDYMIPGVFVVLDRFPLTPNGKVDRQRLASPEYAQRPRLGTDTDYAAPTNAWQTYLTQLWANCLRVESVGIHDNFFDLGGDSITAIQIAAQATEAGLALSPQNILQQLTVTNVLSQLDTINIDTVEPGQVSGPIPLTPVQSSFFEQVTVEPHHWNQSLVLDVDRVLDPAALETALQKLVKHHTILRYSFIRGELSWQQQPSIAAPELLSNYSDLSDQTIDAQATFMAATEAQLQTSLDLTTGKLLRAALFNLGDTRPNRLVLIIHHLAVDGVSWLTLLNDLETFYRQTIGENVAPPLPTTPFQTWAAGLAKRVSADAFNSELSYWLKPAQTDSLPLLRDAQRGGNPVAAMHTVKTVLSREQTSSLLKDLTKASRAQVNEILLTALALTLGDSGGLLVDLEGHGRQESVVPGANLVRTVGWFTTVYPLLLRLPPSDIGKQLQAVKEQVRGVPNHGIGYGLLRYMSHRSEVKAQLESVPQAEVLFNYLGDLAGLVPVGSMFHMARELQLSRSPRGERRYLLEVNAAVVQGQLQMEWAYGHGMHQRETVQAWADELIQGVRSLITHYLTLETSPATAAVDFPLANLNNNKLGKIAALLNKADQGGG